MLSNVCPFLQQLAKEPAFARNAGNLAALCPHLSKTGLSPLAVLAGVGAQAAPLPLPQLHQAQAPAPQAAPQPCTSACLPQPSTARRR